MGEYVHACVDVYYVCARVGVSVYLCCVHGVCIVCVHVYVHCVYVCMGCAWDSVHMLVWMCRCVCVCQMGRTLLRRQDGLPPLTWFSSLHSRSLSFLWSSQYLAFLTGLAC